MLNSLPDSANCQAITNVVRTAAVSFIFIVKITRHFIYNLGTYIQALCIYVLIYVYIHDI